MSDYDLVLSPVAPEVAPLYRTKLVGERQFSYTLPYSLTARSIEKALGGWRPASVVG
jgi:hypothetical protein